MGIDFMDTRFTDGNEVLNYELRPPAVPSFELKTYYFVIYIFDNTILYIF